MIRRLRDVKKGFGALKIKGTISYEQWQQIEDRARFAKVFLNPENPMYQILKEDLENAKNTIIEGRVRKVEEVRFQPAQMVGKSLVPEQVKRIFTTPRKIQIDELAGQYKYIRDFLAQVQSWVDIKERYEKDEANGQLSIQRNR